MNEEPTKRAKRFIESLGLPARGPRLAAPVGDWTGLPVDSDAPDRRRDIKPIGAAVGLLAERLGAAAAHFGAGLGLGGTGTHAGEESDHGVMNRLFALFEFQHRIRQFVTVDAVALAIKYIQNFRHILHPFLTACLTMTMPPFGPGIAPRTSSTFSSAITRTTFRFCTVRRTLPM